MVTIRCATSDDIPSLTLLMDDLGYPATLENMQSRFDILNAHPDYRALVAVTANDEIAGMIGLIKNYYFEHNGAYVRIGALVVGKGYRNRGIGKKLMSEAENWAKEIGVNTILVNSGNRDERAAAYAFYLQLGYVIKSSGFVKNLIPGLAK